MVEGKIPSTARTKGIKSNHDKGGGGRKGRKRLHRDVGRTQTLGYQSGAKGKVMRRKGGHSRSLKSFSSSSPSRQKVRDGDASRSQTVKRIRVSEKRGEKKHRNQRDRRARHHTPEEGRGGPAGAGFDKGLHGKNPRLGVWAPDSSHQRQGRCLTSFW